MTTYGHVHCLIQRFTDGDEQTTTNNNPSITTMNLLTMLTPTMTASNYLPPDTENPPQTTTNTGSVLPLPKAAYVAVIAVAIATFTAIVLCSGVMVTAAIQREVGRRKRRSRLRQHNQQTQTSTNLRRNQPRRLHFAMRSNEAYNVHPYHSSSELGPLQDNLGAPGQQAYYEEISPYH